MAHSQSAMALRQNPLDLEAAKIFHESTPGLGGTGLHTIVPGVGLVKVAEKDMQSTGFAVGYPVV